jgi:two-component system, sensor histidine kinase and response regulator
MTDSAKPTQQEPGTVLIVDDDQIMRHILRHLLESNGHLVEEAADGLNIMELVSHTRPDLILLDAMIPGMDGFEICRLLQTLPTNERVPVLIITALEEEEYVDRAFEAGAVDYVNKPINFAVLKQRVRRLIDMRRLEQMRDELTQMIVHDMKNPIATIRGFSEILLADLSDNADASDLLNRIYFNSNYLLDMAMMLLDMSRIEEGKLMLRPQPRHVHEVLSEAQDAFRWMAQSYSVTVKILACESDIEYTLDWTLIGRVLGNLISNAIKHSPEGSTIELSCMFDPSNGLKISVRDYGEGIAPEDQKIIFEKFKQATKRARGSRHDTGLGLTFSKLATEAHGGTIELQSDIGQGATFTMCFPPQTVPALP